jgi:hypothetical protein
MSQTGTLSGLAQHAAHNAMIRGAAERGAARAEGRPPQREEKVLAPVLAEFLAAGTDAAAQGEARRATV